MTVRVIQGDCRKVLQMLPDQSVNCCITSPPYFGLRDYGCAGQIGLEKTPEAFVAELVAVFREVRRVLRDDGTLWLNLGDSYAANRSYQVPSTKGGPKIGPAQSVGGSGSVVPDGLKPKDLIGIPWRVAFALQEAGWYLRQDIIWAKPNPMPESVTDRCTKAHEYIFLLSKSPRYYFDAKAISEPALGGVPGNVTHKFATAYDEGDERHRTKAGLLAYSFKRKTATTPPPGKPTQHREDREDIAYNETRNKRSVWTVATQPFKEAHFATFPPALIEPCILAGCPKGGTVLDPFGGAGTTGLVADRLGRDSILIELNQSYAVMASDRIRRDSPLFAEVTS